MAMVTEMRSSPVWTEVKTGAEARSLRAVLPRLGPHVVVFVGALILIVAFAELAPAVPAIFDCFDYPTGCPDERVGFSDLFPG